MQPSGDSGDCATPGYMVSAGAGGTTAQTPTSALSDLIKQYTGGGQSGIGAQPYSATSPVSSAIPASSQPYTTAQPATIATPASSGASTNAGVTTTASPSTIATPTTISGSSAVSPTNVSDLLGTNTNTSAQTQPKATTSAFDLINTIANPTFKAVTTATGAPIALNQDLGQQGSLAQGGYAPGAMQQLNDNVVSLAAGTAQQTFVSNDLQYSQNYSTQVPVAQTTLGRTLEILKTALVKLAGMLTPFGNHGIQLQQQYIEARE